MQISRKGVAGHSRDDLISEMTSFLLYFKDKVLSSLRQSLADNLLSSRLTLYVCWVCVNVETEALLRDQILTGDEFLNHNDDDGLTKDHEDNENSEQVCEYLVILLCLSTAQ